MWMYGDPRNPAGKKVLIRSGAVTLETPTLIPNYAAFIEGYAHNRGRNTLCCRDTLPAGVTIAGNSLPRSSSSSSPRKPSLSSPRILQPNPEDQRRSRAATSEGGWPMTRRKAVEKAKLFSYPTACAVASTVYPSPGARPPPACAELHVPHRAAPRLAVTNPT